MSIISCGHHLSRFSLTVPVFVPHFCIVFVPYFCIVIVLYFCIVIVLYFYIVLLYCVFVFVRCIVFQYLYITLCGVSHKCICGNNQNQRNFLNPMRVALAVVIGIKIIMMSMFVSMLIMTMTIGYVFFEDTIP